MLFSLLFTVGFAQQVSLSTQYNQIFETIPRVEIVTDQGTTVETNVVQMRESFTSKFSEKFSCFHDTNNVYKDWADVMYPGGEANWPNDGAYYCCGYMANGRRQCDKINHWYSIGDSHFALCDEEYWTAVSEKTSAGQPKPRRDLCCENDHFNDCNLCKSFVVWDFTVSRPVSNNDRIREDPHGGDVMLERSWKKTDCVQYQEHPDFPNQQENFQLLEQDYQDDSCGTVHLNADVDWREKFEHQPRPEVYSNARGEYISFPPYAYDNKVYPGGYMRATLREFNDPPVCVYVPQVAGRVIEVRVEPEESGSQICVDDMHEDSLERNEPGVTQACDDSRLSTCFPDAETDADEGRQSKGFSFLISCAESCADSDTDLWFRVRASINRWTDAGDSALGTDQADVNTEMWCMWGNQDMTDGEGASTLPDLDIFNELDGNFAKWDVFPSDLTPEEDPVVRPVQSSAFVLSLVSLSIVALFF